MRSKFEHVRGGDGPCMVSSNAAWVMGPWDPPTLEQKDRQT